MKYKYCLIVSQYHHNYHMFIVKIKDNFIEQARKFALELMNYKRTSESMREKSDTTYFGDLNTKYTEIRYRYNINDAGDIYFINYDKANSCMNVANEYALQEKRASVGYKKQAISDKLSNHHDYNEIIKIVEKYFEII